ncbi:MAG: YcjX family protein [Motiliproteus sp.]
MSQEGTGSRVVDTVKGALGKGADSTVESLHRLRSGHKCIGITGLSRSGKSTFITSLISQLINHEKSKLGAFSPWISKRIKAVKVHPLEDRSLSDFPYIDAIKSLTAEPPCWPDSTVDISGCLLEIKLLKKGPWPWEGSTKSVFLELRDYPGEWLLDLPLMEMSFSEWCSQCAALFTKEPRASLLGSLLKELQQLDPLAPFDEETLNELKLKYVEFLKHCKYKTHALSLIQPGRFLIPGEFAGDEALQFVPILSCNARTRGQLENASANSYFKVLEKRYNDYVNKVISPFYKKFFRPIDRQVVLVDVINALNGGPEYIADMQHALSNICDSFSYGNSSPIMKLFRPKIEKVIFAASKIDQVVAKDHDNVRQLLSSVVRKALEEAAYKGAEHKSEAIAAIRSSNEADLRGSFGLKGVDLDGAPIGYIHPVMPDHVPSTDEWQPFIDWKIPLLRPPSGVRCDQDQAIPHIRMDQVLQDLIGDMCS